MGGHDVERPRPIRPPLPDPFGIGGRPWRKIGGEVVLPAPKRAIPQFFLALGSWCADRVRLGKQGENDVGAISAWGVTWPGGPVKTRTMNPHSCSMEIHRAPDQRPPNYHHL
jgi:hypothetical protein